jgi:hypothetical protein
VVSRSNEINRFRKYDRKTFTVSVIRAALIFEWMVLHLCRWLQFEPTRNAYAVLCRRCVNLVSDVLHHIVSSPGRCHSCNVCSWPYESCSTRYVSWTYPELDMKTEREDDVSDLAKTEREGCIWPCWLFHFLFIRHFCLIFIFQHAKTNISFLQNFPVQ